MNRLIIILVLTTLVSCADKKPNKVTVQATNTPVTKTEKIDNGNINDRLKRHFDL